MFFEWFGDLGIGDKVTVIIGGGLFVGFILVIYIARIKYEWEREGLSEYWKESHENKDFEDLDNKNDTNK